MYSKYRVVVVASELSTGKWGSLMGFDNVVRKTYLLGVGCLVSVRVIYFI